MPNSSSLSLEFAYGPDSAPLVENRVAAAQVLSGTGGLRVCAQLIERLPRLTGSSQKPVCYMPEPTWGNHAKVFQDAGVEVRRYRYLDAEPKTTLDYEGMKEDLMKAESGSTILLHACAHNPTGVDPSPDQWRDLSSALKKTDLQLFFDCAYQGFASGDAEADAVATKLCRGRPSNITVPVLREELRSLRRRVGALSAVCASTEEKAALESQLKAIIRPMYSSPPIPARVVKEGLGDATLRAQWTGECKEMANRIQDMRALLRRV